MNYKLLQRTVGAGLLSGALFLSGVAHAALVTNKVPLLGYANQVLKVYRAPGNMQTSISIPAKTALIQIMQIRTDGWAYGSYPISGGRRANGWFKISDIQPYINFNNWEAKPLYDNYRVERVADYSGLQGSNGNISRSDALLVVGQQGQMLQIIYKQKNSANWRIGWVSEKAVQRVQVGTTVTQNKMQAQVQRTQTATSAKQSVTTTPNSNTLQNKQNANAVKTTNTTNVVQQNNSKTTSNTNAGKLILVDSPMTKITTNSSSGIGTPYRPNVGDLNGDGQITITDVSKINAHNIGLEPIDSKYLDNADMNGDGAITITDVSNLKMVQIGNDNIEIYRRRPFKIKAKQRVNAYSTPTLTNWDGYSSVFKDDLIYIFEESGNAYHVKYPTSKGEKTMWVSKDVLNTVSTSASSFVATPTPAQGAVVGANAVLSYVYPVNGFYKLTTLFYYNSVSRSMGYKHSVWWNRTNNGHFNSLDIECNNGTKVKAVAAGTVTSENQGTNHIIVIDHGNMKSLYAHLRKKYVTPGTQVYAGQEIGEASDIGIGGGNYHLHLEFSNSSPWEYYRTKVPFQYCRSTLSAYNKRCEPQDKQRFGEAINWILKNTQGFTTD